MRLPLLLSALALSAGWLPAQTPPRDDTGVAPVAAPATDEAYAALASAFREAEAAFDARLAAADAATARELRKNRPEEAFYGRFREAGLAGSGRSLLWAARNVRKSGLGRDERDAHLVEYAGKLLREHRDEAWFVEEGAFEFLARQGRVVGDDVLEAMFLEVGEKARAVETRALALVVLAGRLQRSSDAAARERGAALLQRLETEFPRDALQAAFSGERFAQLFLNVGQIAPDFTAKTVDGETFRLSDFRGKVTLIDFWGFW